MAIATRPLTYDDLLRTPENDGKRYEIIGGEMVVTASPAKKHVWLGARLSRWLGNFAEEHALGEVYPGPVDVRLTPYDIVVPDIIFIRAERAHIFGDQLVDGPPDLIVEILSPSTRRHDLTDKMRLYARAGVAEYWVIDPLAKTVRSLRSRPPGEYEAIEPVEGRVASRVLAGLVVDPAYCLPICRRVTPRR